MKLIFLSMSLLFTSSLFPLEAKVQSLKEFYTDGCTMFADGTPKNPGLWRHCCVEHDLRYWYGGDFQERDIADFYLKECVNEVAGIKWAKLIYKGVRSGHNSPVKSKTFWGWGWSLPRENVSLEQSEITYVKAELRQLPFEKNYIEDFIVRYFGPEKL